MDSVEQREEITRETVVQMMHDGYSKEIYSLFPKGRTVLLLLVLGPLLFVAGIADFILREKANHLPLVLTSAGFFTVLFAKVLRINEVMKSFIVGTTNNSACQAIVEKWSREGKKE